MNTDTDTVRQKFESLYARPPKTRWDDAKQEYYAIEGAPNRIVNEAFVYTRMLDGFKSGVWCIESKYEADLVDALDDALKDLIGYQVNARKAALHDSEWCGVSEIIQPRIDKARAALAKATGEQ